MHGEVMPEGFVPRRRGRRPSYDLSDVLAELTANPGRWVKFYLSTTEGKSAQRQLSRMTIDVALEIAEDDPTSAVLYVRSTA